jgi:hypothetical protein
MRSCQLMAPGTNPGYERAYRIWRQVTNEFAEGLTPSQTGPLPARHEQARALLERYICRLCKAGSIAANERGAFHAGGRAAADPKREAPS